MARGYKKLDAPIEAVSREFGPARDFDDPYAGSARLWQKKRSTRMDRIGVYASEMRDTLAEIHDIDDPLSDAERLAQIEQRLTMLGAQVVRLTLELSKPSRSTKGVLAA